MSSLWDRTQKLPKELFNRVEKVYGDHFPLEVRFQLAMWVEENFLVNPFPIKEEFGGAGVQGGPSLGAALAEQLLMKLNAQAESIPDDHDKFMTKKQLQLQCQNLQRRYGDNLELLAVTVKQCLERELEIVEQNARGMGSPVEQSLEQQIRQNIDLLKQKVNQTGEELEHCKQVQESLTMDICHFKENTAKWEQLKGQQGEAHPDVKKHKARLDQMENKLKQMFGRLSQQRNNVVSNLVANFRAVKEVQDTVLNKELINWKREQQLAGNGFIMTLSLETLQSWCEGLAHIIWSLRTQLKQLEVLLQQLGDNTTTNSKMLPELLVGITDLLSNLVTGTFIIEKQPPQVMKTNTKFQATVRLLVGGQLNVHMASPSVSVSIISETQANQLLKSPPQAVKRREDYSSGEILNGQGNMEYHQTTRQVSVTFRNLQLKRIKRTEKKGTESVMEEKFSVLFWTEFQIGELKFQVWTLSLPVVVIVHGNQEPQALATITWDNAFAEWGRPPFRVPEKVEWFKMATALNMKWTSACGTSRSLTNDNLYYLACKAFRNPNLLNDDFKNLQISWGQFCRDPLPDRNFTFWEWFYRVMNLTSNHMGGPWSEGYIMGFVSKQSAEELLMSREGGCFLLRFSDSELGGVTIAYVRQDQHQKNVFMVAPFTTKDLSQRSIADVIFDLQEYLTYLYPDIPKVAFKKFTTSPSQQDQKSTQFGYVPHSLRSTLSGHSSLETANGGPASPYTTSLGMQDPGYETFPYQDGEMLPDVPFDPSTININDILGIATTMINSQGGGSMDINLSQGGGSMDIN